MLKVVGFGFVLLVSVAFAAERACASDLQLSWAAPNPSCPDREQVRAGISQRLQREIRLGVDAELRMAGQIAADAAGYRLDLRTHERDGDQQRVLHARTCNELARAGVLIASLLLGGAGLTSDSAAAVDPAARNPVRLYARAQLIGDLGALPAPALGAAVLVGIELDRALLELGVLAFLPREAASLERGPATTSLQLMAAEANVCWRLLDRPALAPCAVLEAGTLRASAQALSGVQAASILWLAVGAGARLGVPLTRTWLWTTELAVSLPWDRAQVGIRELGPVHHVPAITGRISSGMQGYF